jgi:hypothetical protein
LSSQQQVEISAVRFQYRGQPDRRGNWENMPFYLRYLRQFLIDHDGEVVWLKGNTGGEEAAYLLFKTDLAEELKKLLSRPLAELGSYDLTAEPGPVEVLRKYYRDGKIGVGRLIFWEEQVGEATGTLTRRFNEGFWYAPIGTSTGAIQLKANRFTQKFHEDENWFCLHDAEETICRSDGTLVATRKHEELWLRESALRTVSRFLPLLAILVVEAM